MNNQLNKKNVICGCILSCLNLNASFAQKSQRPNIIVILSDDAGYGDFGFTGSKDFKTPHLDQFASKGVVFTNAYVSSAVCGPSRAGLLTGRYQQRFGFIYNNVPGAIDKEAGLYGDLMGLPTDQKTIAGYLGKYGYKSMIVGKWHQGHGAAFHPLRRGFDQFYGFLGGARNYIKTSKLDDEVHLWRNLDTIPEPEGYLTDCFAEEACRFIEKSRQSPFFLYLAFNAVHAPNQAKNEDLELFVDVKPDRKILAAMTWSLDKAIGKVMGKLEQLGLEENTLVIFTNDNGGASYNGADNSPFSGCKATYLEGGIRVPFMMKWKGHLKEGQKYEYPVITLDILPTSIALAGGNPENIKELDGVNLLPFISGSEKSRPHETFYWNGDGPFSAIRDHDWKLIKMPDRLPELYNLATDPSEKINLANGQQKITEELLKKLFEWENANGNPKWQLLKKYEKVSIEFFDKYRK